MKNETIAFKLVTTVSISLCLSWCDQGRGSDYLVHTVTPQTQNIPLD